MFQNIDTNIDFESPKKILQRQMEGLKTHLQYLSSHSKYYQRLFSQHGIDPSNITSLEELQKLPLTNKLNIEQNNQDFVCISAKETLEFVTTSGTLSDPITVVLDKNDLDRLGYNEARSLHLCGIGDDDIIQITTTLDKRFMAGMAYYLGATKLGAAVIRSGIGDLSFQLDNIKRYQPTVLIAVPSFAYKLGKYLIESGIDLNGCSVKKIVCIGETIRQSNFEPTNLLNKLQELWGEVEFYSTYASTEMATAFTECEYGKGGHILPELIIVEIIDEKGNPVENGDLGEVVVTPLAITGMPLIRYKTGDLARLFTYQCQCGRHTPRLGPIEGRKDHMIKLKGTTLFPTQIENALKEFDEIDEFVIELSHTELQQDQLKIYFPDSLSAHVMKTSEKAVAEKLRVKIPFVQIPIVLLHQMTNSNNSRKPKRLLDIRKNNSKNAE